MKQISQKLAAAAGFLLLQPFLVSAFYAETLSDRYYVRNGEMLELSTALPISATPTEPATAASLTACSVAKADLRLFGIFPIKHVEIQQTDEIMLVPGGQAFGIRMLMDGIMVIGFGEVLTAEGPCCPAASAGLQEGDVIRTVNGVPLTSTADFRQLAASGTPLSLTVLRQGEELSLSLTPAYAEANACWQTGLWVRDSTAGIGTITYYEPESGSFAGLGHPICDADTGERIPLGTGEADAVTISGAVKGRAGAAGQLQGYFSAEAPIGTLFCNSHCGLFGVLHEPPAWDTTAVPMALKQEVTLGEAVILSTVEGDAPQAYTIRIIEIDNTAETQNLTIQVTDEDLLARTGGIVQGMSGSPILQNGKLIGAVTHVFISNPTQGYGIFAETMYDITSSIDSDA